MPLFTSRNLRFHYFWFRFKASPRQTQKSLLLSASFFRHECWFFNCNYTLKELWKWKKAKAKTKLCVMQQSLSISFAIKSDYEMQKISLYSKFLRLRDASNGQDFSIFMCRHYNASRKKEIEQFQFWQGDERRPQLTSNSESQFSIKAAIKADRLCLLLLFIALICLFS